MTTSAQQTSVIGLFLAAPWKQNNTKVAQKHASSCQHSPGVPSGFSCRRDRKYRLLLPLCCCCCSTRRRSLLHLLTFTRCVIPAGWDYLAALGGRRRPVTWLPIVTPPPPFSRSATLTPQSISCVHNNNVQAVWSTSLSFISICPFHFKVV